MDKEILTEGRDSSGFAWIQDPNLEDTYFLKDFEHLVVMKVNNFSESLPLEHWEAIIYEDESRGKIIGREEFRTEEEAKHCLEQIMELTIKNRMENK